jgi:hypothetical protein
MGIPLVLQQLVLVLEPLGLERQLVQEQVLLRASRWLVRLQVALAFQAPLLAST